MFSCVYLFLNQVDCLLPFGFVPFLGFHCSWSVKNSIIIDGGVSSIACRSRLQRIYFIHFPCSSCLARIIMHCIFFNYKPIIAIIVSSTF